MSGLKREKADACASALAFTGEQHHFDTVREGSPDRTRTCDKVVNSHLLYQLSYRGK